MGLNSDTLKKAVFVLGVFAVAALIQTKIKVPVIGDYLPGGANA